MTNPSETSDLLNEVEVNKFSLIFAFFLQLVGNVSYVLVVPLQDLVGNSKVAMIKVIKSMERTMIT